MDDIIIKILLEYPKYDIKCIKKYLNLPSSANISDVANKIQTGNLDNKQDLNLGDVGNNTAVLYKVNIKIPPVSFVDNEKFFETRNTEQDFEELINTLKSNNSITTIIFDSSSYGNIKTPIIKILNSVSKENSNLTTISITEENSEDVVMILKEVYDFLLVDKNITTLIISTIVPTSEILKQIRYILELNNPNLKNLEIIFRDEIKDMEELSLGIGKNIVLEKLNLNYNNFILDDDMCQDFRKMLAKNKTIKELNISYTNLQENPCIFYDALRFNKGIDKLIYSGDEALNRQVTDDIAKLIRNKKYTFLDLSGMNKDISILTPSLKKNKFLKFLNLDSNGIRDSECKSLCDALKENNNLRILLLANNNISNKCARQLLNVLVNYNDTLAKIDLYNTSISQNLLNQIYNEFPIRSARLTRLKNGEIAPSPKDFSNAKSVGDEEMLSLLNRLSMEAENARSLIAATEVEEELPLEAKDCSNNADVITLENWSIDPNNPELTYLPDLRLITMNYENNNPEKTYCFEKEGVLYYMSQASAQYGLWMSANPNFVPPNFDENGRVRGDYTKSSKQVLYSLPLDFDGFLMDSIEKIKNNDVLYLIPIAKEIRVGNRRNTYGVGDLHGQYPGKTIYIFSKSQDKIKEDIIKSLLFQFGLRTNPWGDKVYDVVSDALNQNFNITNNNFRTELPKILKQQNIEELKSIYQLLLKTYPGGNKDYSSGNVGTPGNDSQLRSRINNTQNTGNNQRNVVRQLNFNPDEESIDVGERDVSDDESIVIQSDDDEEDDNENVRRQLNFNPDEESIDVGERDVSDDESIVIQSDDDEEDDNENVRRQLIFDSGEESTNSEDDSIEA